MKTLLRRAAVAAASVPFAGGAAVAALPTAQASTASPAVVHSVHHHRYWCGDWGHRYWDDDCVRWGHGWDWGHGHGWRRARRRRARRRRARRRRARRRRARRRRARRRRARRRRARRRRARRPRALNAGHANGAPSACQPQAGGPFAFPGVRVCIAGPCIGNQPGSTASRTSLTAWAKTRTRQSTCTTRTRRPSARVPDDRGSMTAPFSGRADGRPQDHAADQIDEVTQK